MELVIKYILLFFIYAFIGWCIEVVAKIIDDRKFVNRGFLIGPILPIYGIGVLLILLVTKQSDNPLWYEHEDFKDTKAKEGVLFYRKQVNEWLESLGIKHEHNMYTKIEGKETPDNIAFFAHGGMAMAFLSTLLDVPYSYFCTHFNCLDTCGVVHIYIDTDNHVARIISYNEVHYDNSLFVEKNEVKF